MTVARSTLIQNWMVHSTLSQNVKIKVFHAHDLMVLDAEAPASLPSRATLRSSSSSGENPSHRRTSAVFNEILNIEHKALD